MKLVVGLGNPGREYENTRHNVGFDVIDHLADSVCTNVNKIKFKGLVGEFLYEGEKIILLKPSTFMNLSGESVREAKEFYKLNVEDIIVVYDDIAIDVGRIRIRPSGSDGGHNGIKNIIYQLNNDKFPRVRVGIGAPKADLVSHVLGKFTPEERKIVDEVIKVSSDAVLEIIKNGVQSAMNKFNGYSALK
ncbi:aminoacyl-tRNA hydrolase [Thermobrachium celere]|uniref:Peptidyl-tRNA hydrolase n=1 Tax=Thermobrachium celere DSM 8682 TaxID=941824 RepID=R7RUM0_9CLOT|nr:aminoacyl-tRNA hydrolase [Thermobrachium celere]CDF59085.1 Peptidyl-tRNA hydrolase [Thermobrachium celere DSM 8682]